jgi:hypothetical protein
MEVGLDDVTVASGNDLKLTVAAKKKTIFRVGSLTKKELRSQVALYVQDGTVCSCTRDLMASSSSKSQQMKLAVSNDTYLVMGLRKNGLLTVTFIRKVNRKSRDMQSALRTIVNDSDCQNGRGVIETVAAADSNDLIVTSMVGGMQRGRQVVITATTQSSFPTLTSQNGGRSAAVTAGGRGRKKNNERTNRGKNRNRNKSTTASAAGRAATSTPPQQKAASAATERSRDVGGSSDRRKGLKPTTMRPTSTPVSQIASALDQVRGKGGLTTSPMRDRNRKSSTSTTTAMTVKMQSKQKVSGTRSP